MQYAIGHLHILLCDVSTGKTRYYKAMLIGRFGAVLLLLTLPWVKGSTRASRHSSPEAKAYAASLNPVRPDVGRFPGMLIQPDTLKRTVRAGEVLILALPDSLDAKRVLSYHILRAPALSWLVDHSFFWRTMLPDTSRHRILIGINRTPGAPPDTLILEVDVKR